MRSAILIEISVTPKDLRIIADRLERAYKAAKPGDEVPHELVDENEDYKVVVYVDQSRMGKK